MKINCVIAIDPGRAGGLAVFIKGEPNVRTARMPKDVGELQAFFQHYNENYNTIVFLEKLSVRPDDVAVEGGNANLGKLYRIQQMMADYEHLKAMLEIVGLPYVMVHPSSWQAKLKLRLPGQKMEKAERKRLYKQMASHWYPEVKTTLWNADALCLLQFARLVLVNDLKWVLSNIPQREHDKLF